MNDWSRRQVCRLLGLSVMGAVGFSGSAQAQASGTTAYVADGGDLTAVDVGLNEVTWSVTPEDADGLGEVIVAGGTAYVTANTENGGAVYAIDASTGSREWGFTSPPTELSQSSPVIADETVYVVSGRRSDDEGVIYAIDSDSGELGWQHEPEDSRVRSGSVFSPRVSDEFLYYPTKERTFHALDTGSEEIIFRSMTFPGDVEGVTVRNDTVFVTDSEAGIWATQAETGSVLWQSEALEDGARSAPIFYQGNVHAVDGTGTIHAVSARTGEGEWEFSPRYSSQVRGLSLWNGQGLVIGRRRDRANRRQHVLSSFDPETGELNWESKAGTDNTYGRVPTSALGTAFTGERRDTRVGASDLRSLHAFDADSGESLYRNSDLGSSIFITIVSNPDDGDSVDSLAENGVGPHHDSWRERSEASSFSIPPAELSVSDPEMNMPITEGDELSVNIEITNDGVARAAPVVEIEFLGETYEEELVLSRSESEVISASFLTEPGDEGNATISIAAGDHTQETQIDIEEAEEDLPETSGTDDGSSDGFGPGFGASTAASGAAVAYLLKRMRNTEDHG